MALQLANSTGLTAVLAVATAGSALTGLSGAATTYSSSAFGYCIDGVAYANGANSGATTPTTNGGVAGTSITLTANKARAVVWAVNAAGTEFVFAGPIVDWTDTTAGSTACPLPAIPAGYAAFAAHTIQGGSTLSGTWTFGSSNWNATGLTVGTVRNLAQVPSNPLTTS